MHNIILKYNQYSIAFINTYNSLSSYKKYLYISFAVGALIRLIGLDYQSLWIDELYSLIAASNDSLADLYNNFFIWDPHPPFYTTFLYYWVKIFGGSPVSIRLPSAIAGILSIYFMYKYSKEYLCEEVAIICSIMISFSYAGIYFSQEARSYSFLILFSIISTFYWLKMQYNNDFILNNLVKYIVIIIITAYIHYFGLLLVCIQLGYWSICTIYYKKPVKYPLIATISLFFAFLPWSFVMISHFIQKSGGEFWIPRPTLRLFMIYLALLFKPYYFSLSLLIIAPILFNFKQHVENLVNFIKKHYSSKSPIFALALLLISMIIIPLLISFHSPIIHSRNLLVIAPLVFIAASIWISLSSIDTKQLVSYVFFSCLLCLFLFMPAYYFTLHKQQFREATFYIIEEASHESLIISSMSAACKWPEYSHAKMFNYYFRYFNYDNNIVYDDLNGVQIDNTKMFYEEFQKTGAYDLFVVESSYLLDKKVIEYYKNIANTYQRVDFGEKWETITVYHFTF